MRCKIEAPFSLTVSTIHSRMAQCKTRCKYFMKHGKRYRARHLQSRLGMMKLLSAVSSKSFKERKAERSGGGSTGHWANGEVVVSCLGKWKRKEVKYGYRTQFG
jgi:hypothetical protein